MNSSAYTKDWDFGKQITFRLKYRQICYGMNEHKMYYNKKDLWPMLVKAGFLPENIRLSYCKFGLNLLGRCREYGDYE